MDADGNYFLNDPSQCPPGHRFDPVNDGDLIIYLKKKILGQPIPFPPDCMPTVELYSTNPTQLPMPKNDNWRAENEWYFFTSKPNNDPVILTSDGYYRVIKEKETVELKGEEVGFMRTLAYFEGTLSSARKSQWTIYEFGVKPETIPATQHDDALKAKVSGFVLCRVRKGSAHLKEKW